MDWFSISQDDEALKLLGIKSLIKYATLSAFMLIPSKETPSILEPNPSDLPGYGSRAWCRLEWLIFSMWAEMQVVRPEDAQGGQLCGPNGELNEDDVGARRIQVAGGRVTEIGRVEGIVRALTQLYAVSLAGGSGLKWTKVGVVKPRSGRAIKNAKLAKALKSATEFTNAEWEEFGGCGGGAVDDDDEIRYLRRSDFVKAGGSYFIPAPEEIMHFEEVTVRGEEDLPDAGDLSLEADRARIRDLQEQMIAAYVPTMIGNQCAGGAGASINLAYRCVCLFYYL